MEKRILLIIFLLYTAFVVGQVTNEKDVKSSFLKMKSNVPTVVMPDVNLKKVQEEDVINDDLRTKPFRFGYEFKVDLGLKNAGIWEELENGDRIWRITIYSKEAKTLNFIFDSYQLPKGATVYLYNEDKSFILGAYTDTMNNDSNTLGTWLTDGERITIEYYEPNIVKGKGMLHIGSVVHGYRSVNNFESYQKALNDSGDCNQDINCPVGADFDEIKDQLKKSVALILSNGTDWCTGTLINNTNNDKAPYLLTAFHCGDLESTWSFRFNWISTNSVCANSTDSTDNGPSNYYETTSGSTRLAKNSESDFRLIEITGGLDENWDLEWAGWDRTGDIPDFTLGMHHPNGDIMKVCRDDDSATKEIVTIDGQTSQVWQVGDWDLGVTERGSSGSALFNQEGKIIGQLFGGSAFCNGTDDNDAPDFYGRFDLSWDFGTTNETRVSNWLDPTNTGIMTLDMLSEVLSVDDRDLKNNTIVYPNPSNGVFSIFNSTGNRLSYTIFSVSGKKINSGKVLLKNEELDISSNSSGVYFMVITEADTKTSFTKKIVITK